VPGKLADRLSNRSVRLARMILIQAVRNAQVNELRRALVSDRHQARPVTRTVAIAPGPLFASRGKTIGSRSGPLGYQLGYQDCLIEEIEEKSLCTAGIVRVERGPV
jgi:hypothetical protein